MERVNFENKKYGRQFLSVCCVDELLACSQSNTALMSSLLLSCSTTVSQQDLWAKFPSVENTKVSSPSSGLHLLFFRVHNIILCRKDTLLCFLSKITRETRKCIDSLLFCAFSWLVSLHDEKAV